MTNVNSDSPRDRLSELLAFCWKQEMKQVHTILPGVVKSYSSSDHRATVAPALQMGIRDKSGKIVEYVDRPLLVDVPVVHPSGGGWTVHIPLAAGDPVLLVFSMRGLERWKATFGVSPEGGAFFGMDSAFALPGPAKNPPSVSGMAISNGVTSITLGTDIVITAPGNVIINATRLVTP